METILFSVGNTDANVRVTNNLYIGSAGGWITDLLAGKQAAGSYAAASHTHAISDVTGLQTALDGKQAAGSYSLTSHTHADATTSVAGFMSAADKTKLNGIASGATANAGTVTSVSGTGTVSGLTLSGTVTSSGSLTLGGTLSLTSANVTTALGFTPYNATNPSGYITSSGSISGSAGSVTGLTLNSSANGINPDSVTQNQIGYNTSVSLFGQTDGGLYSSAYSSAWIHQIYGDFRTGQIAIRGKNSGAWQAWRTVLDSSNFSTWAAAASHTHTIANITGLQTALDGKQAAGSYLTTSGKAADSELLDGINSSSFVRNDTTSQYLRAYYQYGNYLTTERPIDLRNQMGGSGMRVDFMNGAGGGSWNHVITFSGYDAYNMYQLGGYYDGGSTTNLYVRSEANHGTVAWTAWRRLLNETADPYAAGMNQYVNTTSDPTFNSTYLANGNLRLYQGGGTALHIQTAYGYGLVGPQNDNWFHIETDRPNIYMGSSLYVNGAVYRYNGSQLVEANGGTWSISIDGNAASASSVAWTNVSSRPTALSQFTNDLGNYGGWITSSGSISGTAEYANYQNPTGSNSDALANFRNTPAHRTSFREISSSGPGGTWWMVQNFRHSNSSNYWGTQVAWGWEDNSRRLMQRNVSGDSWSDWVEYLNSGNFTSWAQEKENQRLSTSSTPTFNGVYTNDWFRANGSTGLYFQTYGYGLRAPEAEGNAYGNVATYGGGRNGWSGYGIGSQYVIMGRVGTDVGLHDNNYGWGWYWHSDHRSLGIGESTTSASYRLYVTGAIYATDDIVAYSDRRKKANIITIDNALDKVLNLRGVYYTKLDDETGSRKTGVIAQEINEILPEVVTYAQDVDEYGVSYGNIVGVLIEAIKEQQAQIDDLKKRLGE